VSLRNYTNIDLRLYIANIRRELRCKLKIPPQSKAIFQQLLIFSAMPPIVNFISTNGMGLGFAMEAQPNLFLQ
jgi:hypothetical protein